MQEENTNKTKRVIIILVSSFVVVVLLVGFFQLQSSHKKTPSPPVELGGESPLVNILPATDVTAPFTIKYVTTKNNVPSLEISDSTPIGREKALEWLYSRDYNPTQLDISFLDFLNPLVDRGE